MKNSIIGKGLCLISLFVFCSSSAFAVIPPGRQLARSQVRNLLRQPRSYHLRTNPSIGGSVRPNIAINSGAARIGESTLSLAQPPRAQLSQTGISTTGISSLTEMPSLAIAQELPPGFKNRARKLVTKAANGQRGAYLKLENVLFQQAAAGDLEGLRTLLDTWNTMLSKDMTSYLLLNALPHPNVVAYLSYRPEFYSVMNDNQEFHPLMRFAIRNGHRESFRILMDKYEHDIDASYHSRTFFRLAVKHNQFGIAEDLTKLFGVDPRPGETLRWYLEHGMDELTDEKLMFLLHNGADFFGTFRPSAVEVLEENVTALEDLGRTTKWTIPEINSELQYQAFHALAEDETLPARFGLTPVEYAKKCYENPGVTSISGDEVTNEWYKTLLSAGIVHF